MTQKEQFDLLVNELAELIKRKNETIQMQGFMIARLEEQKAELEVALKEAEAMIQRDTLPKEVSA